MDTLNYFDLPIINNLKKNAPSIYGLYVKQSEKKWDITSAVKTETFDNSQSKVVDLNENNNLPADANVE
jgi:hypothetical protein